jgi:hypothetical protein
MQETVVLSAVCIFLRCLLIRERCGQRRGTNIRALPAISLQILALASGEKIYAAGCVPFACRWSQRIKMEV